jgi:hypothetical protein
METTERAAIYAKYVEEAAEQYRCKPTDMKAKMAATRRLAFELYQVGLIEGRNPDPSILKWFLEEESKHAPPPEPAAVTVEFAETLVGICEKCGHEHQTGKPVTDPDPPPTPTPPSPPSAPPTTETSPAPTNVVPLKRSAAEDERAFILQRTAPPLQTSAPWRAYVAPNLGGGDGSNPLGVIGSPTPNFEQHHPLPTPNYKG